VPALDDNLGLVMAVGVAVVLLVWYFAAIEIMRRRAHRLAIWTRLVLDPFGGKQSMRWLGGQMFRMEVEDARPPFRALLATGLVESWHTPLTFAVNRWRRRGDVLVLHMKVRRQPPFEFEVYRPGTLLAGESRQHAGQGAWAESTLGELRAAAVSDEALRYASEMLEVLGAQRGRLIRLATQRHGHHVTVGLNVTSAGDLRPEAVSALMERMAEHILKSHVVTQEGR
jgi:hypothetical protein